MSWCRDCPYIGNDEVCWSQCELDRELEEEIADEFEPEVADDDEDEPMFRETQR